MTLARHTLSTFLIHYTPLSDRLTSQHESETWKLLSPVVVNESHDWVADHLSEFEDIIYTFQKIEVVSQVTQIYHILDYHYRSICSGSYLITTPVRRRETFSDKAIIAHNFYLQALSAYSKKNYQLSLQHHAALRTFLERGSDICLILEDDSLPITQNIETLADQLQDLFDHVLIHSSGFYDISNSFFFRPDTTINEFTDQSPFVKMEFGQTKCASAYVVTRKCAELLLSARRSLLLPIDWHYSYILSLHRIPTYWSIFPIFRQGSQTGDFMSNSNSRGMRNFTNKFGN